MALAKKLLTAVNDTIELAIPNEENGAVSFQIPSGAVGTYTLEATLNGSDYIAIQFTNLNNGAIQNSIAAPGIYWANVLGFLKVRVKKTVGAAAEMISLSINDE